MDADVIVIGAGIVGLAAAHELAARGRDVLVVELDRPGCAQSAGDSRIFRLAHDDHRHVEQAMRADAGWRRWERTFDRELNDRCGLIVTGAAAPARLAAMRKVGAPSREITDITAVSDRLPGLAGLPAMIDMRAGVIRLPDTITALSEHRTIIRAHANLVRNTPSGPTVELGHGGRLRARAVIVCAGQGTHSLAAASGKALPGVWRRHTRFTYRPARHADSDRWAAWIHRSDTDAFYALPTPDGGYAVGTSSPDEDPRVDETTRERWHEQLRDRTDRIVAEHMPDLDASPTASEDCCYLDSPDFGGHDGTVVYPDGAVRWVLAVNVAKMAPAIGADLADDLARTLPR